MAKRFSALEASHADFVRKQRVFFTGSAAREGRVNVSPKDVAALRVLDAKRIAYLDQTGSGNETAAHIRAHGRLTLMFCALDGPPMILRVYGQGKVLARGSAAYRELLESAFGGEERTGARQIVVLDIEMVLTSCGYGVPLFDYAGERPTLTRWAEQKGEDGLEAYRHEKNQFSLDGFPTGLLEPEDEIHA